MAGPTSGLLNARPIGCCVRCTRVLEKNKEAKEKRLMLGREAKKKSGEAGVG